MNDGCDGLFHQRYTKLPNFTKEGCHSWLDAAAGIFASEGCRDDAQKIKQTLNVLPDDLLLLIGAHLNELYGDCYALTEVLLREYEVINSRALMATLLKKQAFFTEKCMHLGCMEYTRFGVLRMLCNTKYRTVSLRK